MARAKNDNGVHLTAKPTIQARMHLCNNSMNRIATFTSDGSRSQELKADLSVDKETCVGDRSFRDTI
jgi:hypothetical protein